METRSQAAIMEAGSDTP